MRLLKAIIITSVCLLCACTKTPDASQIIEKAEAGETLTDEDFKVLSNYVNSAMTSDEAKALSEASSKALKNPTPETTWAMESAVKKMEQKWPLLQKASLFMATGGAIQPLNGFTLPADTTTAPIN